MQDKQNDKKTLVSFIIPFYNVPLDLLRQCLDSILALSLHPAERELILVDDGSDQSPLFQLQAYLPSIIYLRQPNGGLSSARNTGLRMASGRYVQFVDADDMLVNAAYDHCLDLVRYSQPDMVMFDLTDKQPTKTAVFDDMPQMNGTYLLRHHNIRGSACGYLFRRKILGELRFTNGIYHEDEEFTPLLLLRADTVVSTNAQAYFYRKREGSIITASSMRHRLRRLSDAQQVLFRLQHTADTLPADARLALQRRVHQLTMDYIYNVILLTNSRHYLNRKLDELKRRNIYPLPNREYTHKYTWFRRMANSRVGLTVLMRIIPLLKREK
jgi:glycosyltransferase involved in cell wall biosynthesis